jgi:hypothetical protein
MVFSKKEQEKGFFFGFVKGFLSPVATTEAKS